MLGKTEGRRRRGQRMSWLDGVADLVDMNLSKLRELMKSRKAWRAAAPGVTESRTRHGNQTTSKPNQTGSKRQKWHQQPFPHQLMVQECAKPSHPQARFQLPSPSSRIPGPVLSPRVARRDLTYHSSILTATPLQINRQLKKKPACSPAAESFFLCLSPVLFIFLINFYWGIVALQCCVSFCRRATRISSARTCIPSVLGFLPF